MEMRVDLFLVVDPVNWVDIRLDGVPAGDPHLADQVHRDGEEQGKDTGQGGETDHCIEEGVVWKYFSGKVVLPVTVVGLINCSIVPRIKLVTSHPELIEFFNTSYFFS